jgi:mannose/fructose/N-acetylgalactosamine-specific phosphotransferase system component IIB
VAIELYRVDDRLVHGQVVLGWGQPMCAGFIVLVDDVVAGNDWERELYRMGTPPGMDIYFETVESAAKRLPEFNARPDAGILLAGDVATMDRLTAAAPAIQGVNIGGLHHRTGRAPKLAYVFLSPDEEAGLAAMAARGVVITAQDVPASDPVAVETLLAPGAR